MFTRVLVPLDGTPHAASALPAARTIARTCGARVTLVRAIDSAEVVELGRVTDYLGGIAGELSGSGLEVDYRIRRGKAADEVVRAAIDSAADLVIMATHGRWGPRRAFLGSVGERVVAESPMPVLLIRPGGKRLTRLRTLLVAVDGTAGGALALGTAIELARTSGDTRVVLVQACAPLPLWMYGGEMGVAPAATIDPAWEEEALAAAETYVAGLARRLTNLGLHAEGRAVSGEAATVIENVARDEDADLIVMSTHGYTGPARAFLGSVADTVVRAAKRPVLLVRRPTGVLEGDGPEPASTADVALTGVN